MSEQKRWGRRDCFSRFSADEWGVGASLVMIHPFLYSSLGNRRSVSAQRSFPFHKTSLKTKSATLQLWSTAATHHSLPLKSTKTKAHLLRSGSRNQCHFPVRKVHHCFLPHLCRNSLLKSHIDTNNFTGFVLVSTCRAFNVALPPLQSKPVP